MHKKIFLPGAVENLWVAVKTTGAEDSFYLSKADSVAGSFMRTSHSSVALCTTPSCSLAYNPEA